MNEQKRLSHEYFYPSQTKQQMAAEELLNAIKMFISQNKLNPSDFHILTKLVRQLNTQVKTSVPNKILRSMQKRFEIIQEQYTR